MKPQLQITVANLCEAGSSRREAVGVHYLLPETLRELVNLWNATPEKLGDLLAGKPPLDCPAPGQVAATFWRERYEERGRLVTRMDEELHRLRAELAQADSWGKACAVELEKVKDKLRGVGHGECADAVAEEPPLWEGPGSTEGWFDRLLPNGDWQHRSVDHDGGNWYRRTTVSAAHQELAKRLMAERGEALGRAAVIWSDDELDRLAKGLANPDDEPQVPVALIKLWIGDLGDDRDARSMLDDLLSYLLEPLEPKPPTFAITDKDADEPAF